MENRFKAQFHVLLHSAHLIERRLVLALEPLGISFRQARVMDWIGRRGAISQAELARQMDVTPASMSTMVDRMLAGGLIERGGSGRKSVRLTPRGTALLTEVDRIWREVDAGIVETLGADDAEALKDLTLRLRNAMGGRGPDDYAAARPVGKTTLGGSERPAKKQR